MTTKQIKNLAVISYTSELLDAKKVNRITKLLSRSELKRYIKSLKSLEQSKTVKVIMTKLDKKSELEKELKTKFPNKRLEFLEDKSLIAGIKIIDNDNIYDFNLANTFENLVSYINQ
jgi:F0F1-type ATP synthase delta subunit